MGKKSGPTPPDPQDLARASTGTNIATAITNQALGSGSQSGPGGSVTRTQAGTHSYTDPYTGESYEIPIYNTQHSLSPEQQAALNQANAPLTGATADNPLGIYGPSYQQAVNSQGSGPSPLGNAQAAGSQGSGPSPLANAQAINNQGGPSYQQAVNNRGPSNQQAVHQGIGLGNIPGAGSFTNQYGGAGSFENQHGGAQSFANQYGGAQSFANQYGGPTGSAPRGPAAGSFTNEYQGLTGTADRDRVEASLRDRIAPGQEAADRRRQISLARRGLGSFSTASGGEGRIAEGARRRQVQQETDAGLAITAAGGREQALQESLRQGAFGRDLASFGANEGAGERAFRRDLSSFGADEGARQNAFGRDLSSFGANQQSIQNAFGRDATSFGLNQQSIQNAFGRDATSFGLNEAATQAGFGRDLSSFGANEAATQAGFGRQLAGTGLNDQLLNTQFNREQAGRGRSIQNLNQILGGGSIPGGSGVQIPTTDVAGLINNQHNQRLGRYQQQSANRNELIGGLLGLGSGFI